VSGFPLPTPTAEIDLGAVSAWLASQGLPSTITDVEALGGGSQNIVLRFRLDGEPVVLRHPPAHRRPHSNKAIAREMDVLSALGGTDVPHPRFIAGCRDESVLGGSVFYLMAAIDGVNPGVEVTDAYRTDPAQVTAAGRDMARVLARLGELDPDALGLSIGHDPDNFIRRQITNGLATWRSFGEVDGYDMEWLTGIERVADWLTEHHPAPVRPGLVHGDYTLSNVMLRRDRGEIAAVLDWEMSTLGDPMLDLGWLLLSWPGEHEPALLEAGKELTALPGMITRRQFVDEYRAVSTRSTEHLDWYVVAACLKFAVMVETTYLRSLEGKVSRELGEYVHGLGRTMMVAANGTIDGTWSILDA
jgi:aminoglycoside phosphotransferase (APT) family kinase protein